MSLKHWQRRPSALSRQALAAYTVLVVYGSLYPFSGWRSLGLGPFAYLTDPLPQYLTAFDVITNVLGYMPFGALAVLALYPRWRGALAAGVAFIGGAMLSGSMEAVQTYLPTRVASNLDLAANALGALLGAALTAPATSMLLDRGLLRRMRFMWFERDAAYMIGLSGLWPFAAMYPAPFLFAVGDLPRVLWSSIDPVMQDALLAWTPAAWNVVAWPAHLGAKLPDDAWETLITSLNLFAALVLATLPMRSPRAARAAAARPGDRDTRRESGRDVPAIALRAHVQLGHRRRHCRHSVRHAGGFAFPAMLAGVARDAGRSCAYRGAGAGESAAGQSVLRYRARRLAPGALSAFQRPFAVACVGVAVCRTWLAGIDCGARISGPAA